MSYFVFFTKEDTETKAIIVTTGATVVYATLTYKLLEEQKRMVQKPRIQAIVNMIILPIYEKIEEQKRFLENRDFRWINENRMYIGKSRLKFSSSGEKLIYYNFRDEFKSVYAKIEKYDKMLSELKKKLDLLAEKIKLIPNFKKEISKKFVEYLDQNQGILGKSEQRKFEPNEKNIEIILRYIVNNMRELYDGCPYEDFWRKYRKELLNFRERKEVKDLKEEIEDKSKELFYLLENIHYDLKRTIQACGKKYGVIPKIEEW